MKKLLVLTAASSLVFLAGCSSSPEKSSAGLHDYEAELVERNKEIDDLKQKLADSEAQANALANDSNAQLSSASVNSQSATHSTANANNGLSDNLLPPNAQPGQCFARVYTPPTYTTSTEKILKAESYDVINIIPATYGSEDKTVLVKEATEVIDIIPAVYGWKEEKVLVSPEITELRRVPAKYGFESSQILVKPAHSIWKKGSGPITKINESTGEIMCLVEVPAAYETVKKRVLITPETTKQVVVKKAVYKTVKTRTVITPAKTVTRKIPAVYDTVSVKKLITPASTSVSKVPAVYETVEKRSKAKDGYLKWAPILCETNVTGDIVRQLQQTLNDKNYRAGPVDGIYGWRTTNGVRKYQKDHNMSGDGQLTIEVVDALGIKY